MHTEVAPCPLQLRTLVPALVTQANLHLLQRAGQELAREPQGSTETCGSPCSSWELEVNQVTLLFSTLITSERFKALLEQLESQLQHTRSGCGAMVPSTHSTNLRA